MIDVEAKVHMVGEHLAQGSRENPYDSEEDRDLGDLEPHRLWRWLCPDGFAVKPIANKIGAWRNGVKSRMWSTSAAIT